MLITHLEPITGFPLSELNYIALTVPHLMFYQPGIQYCYSQFTTPLSAASFTTSPSTPLSTHREQNRPCHLLPVRLLATVCHRATSQFLPRTSHGLPDVSHQCRAEGHHHLPQPTTAQEAAGPLCRQGAFAGSCSTCCPV